MAIAITPENIYLILCIITALTAIIYSIKKTGASEAIMLAKLLEVEKMQCIHTDRIDKVEKDGYRNEKAIGEILIGIDWIKESLTEIKGNLSKRRDDWNIKLTYN